VDSLLSELGGCSGAARQPLSLLVMGVTTTTGRSALVITATSNSCRVEVDESGDCQAGGSEKKMEEQLHAAAVASVPEGNGSCKRTHDAMS
jgi:hypothetical protein